MGAYQKLLEGAELAAGWQAKHITSKHNLNSDLGLDRALEEAWGVGSASDDSLEAKAFEEALEEATGLTGDDIEDRLEVFAGAAFRKNREAPIPYTMAEPIIDIEGTERGHNSMTEKKYKELLGSPWNVTRALGANTH